MPSIAILLPVQVAVSRRLRPSRRRKSTRGQKLLNFETVSPSADQAGPLPRAQQLLFEQLVSNDELSRARQLSIRPSCSWGQHNFTPFECSLGFTLRVHSVSVPRLGMKSSGDQKEGVVGNWDRVASVLLFLCLSWCATLSAQTVHLDRASFVSAAPQASRAQFDFDALPPGSVWPGSLQGAQFLAGAGSNLTVIDAGVGINGPLAASSGTGVLSPGGSDPLLDQDDLTIIFSQPVSAFGIDVVYSLPAGTSFVSVTFYDAADNVLAVENPLPVPGGAPGYQFVGFTSAVPLLSRVEFDDFGPVDPNEHIAFDSLTFDCIDNTPFFIAACEAVSTTLPSVPGDGTFVEVFNGIGGGSAPLPSTIASLTPSGTMLSPFVDFPRPGSTVSIGQSLSLFFASTTSPPAQIANLNASNFILRVTGFLAVSDPLDLDPADADIDIQLGVGSDDGFYLSVGSTFVDQKGDRAFNYRWRTLSFEVPGLYPFELLFAANSVGVSGLEFAWQTQTGGTQIIPQSALYLDVELCDRKVEFEEFAVGTLITSQYNGDGLGVNVLSGDVQITNAFPTQFVPVSGDRVFGDPNVAPADDGIVEFTFVDPLTAEPAVTDFFSVFVIDAEATGAIVTAFDVDDLMVFQATVNAGGGTQEEVVIEAPLMARVQVNLGSGADTSALDNICFNTPVARADLSLTSVSAPPSIGASTDVEISWTVENVGPASALGGWVDRVYLSPDGSVAAGTLLGTFAQGPLSAGQSYTAMENVTVPASFSGSYNFVVVTNADGALSEPAETAANEGVSASITVTNPDLVAPSFSLPTNGFVGDTLSFSISVDNVGSDAIAGSWSDAIYFSLNSTPQIGMNDIPAATVAFSGDVVGGAGYSLDATLTLPAADGEYWVKVDLDLLDQLEEGAGDADNLFVSDTSITLGVPARPNLRPVVTSISHPTSASVGDLVTVDYEVENAGDLDVTTSYVERVYASVDTFIGGDVLLAENSFSALPQGTSAPRSVEFPVPDLPQGFYFVVCVDATDTLTESDETDNCGRSTTRLDVLPPDLLTSNPVVPASAIAGDSIAVTASITNVGPAAALGPWIARFYLSTDASLGADDILVGSEVRLDPLANAEVLTIDRMITVPDRIEGSFQLLLQADYFDDVNESDELNNLGVSSVINVSQPPRPDLVVTSITTPADGLSGFPLTVEYVVTNQAGSASPTAVASGPWLDRVEAVPTAGGSSVVLGEVLRTDTLADGESYTALLPTSFPAVEDEYEIRVTTEVTDLINEGLAGGEANNSLRDLNPFQVSSFTVSVTAAVDDALAGTPIELTGTATLAGSGNPIADAPVMIGVRSQGVERLLTAQSDMAGDFNVTFAPLANEAGLYELVAGPVGNLDPAVQDTFHLWGMQATPLLTYSLTPNQSLIRSLSLTNLGDVSLTGVAATVDGAPAGVTVNLSVPTTLVPTGATFGVEVSTDGTSFGAHPITLNFTSDQGAAASTTLGVTLVTPQPVLVTSPNPLTESMLRGAQTLVQFEVSNQGGAPATDLEILLPSQFDWLNLGVGALPDLQPGESASVILQLTPPDTLGLQPYGGGIAINAQGNGTVVSTIADFTFEAVSDQFGDLQVKVTDESSFYVDDGMGDYVYFPEGTELAGATVRVFEAFDQDLVAEAVTDGGDYLAAFPNLPEGYYEVRVNAPDHAPYTTTILVETGVANVVEAFIPFQAVTYNWIVEETEIEDVTIITLENTFETFVPYPVVTVDPPLLDLAEVTGNIAQFEFTVTNTGFVTANDLFLTFGSHPNWLITPLIEDIGDLAADTSITVPVIVERIQPITAGGGGSGSCEISAGIEWRLFCIFWRYYWVPLPVLNVEGDCGVPSSGSPGGGWTGGGGTGGSPGQPFTYIPSLSPPLECDPCDPETFTPEEFCVGLEASIGGAVAAVLGALESVVPFIEDVEASVGVEGCLQTCCIDGGIGLALSAAGSAAVSAEIDIAEVEFGIPSSLPGVGITLEAGCDIPINLSLEFAVERTCEGENEVTVCLSGGLSPGCGAEVEVEVDGAGVDVDAAALDLRLGVSASLCYMDGMWTGKVCFEGLYVQGVLQVPVEGSLQPVFQGTYCLINGACFPAGESGTGPCFGSGGGAGAATVFPTAPFDIEPITFPQTLVRYRRIPVGPPSAASSAATSAGGSQEAVCAQVRLQIQQEVAVTRSAFNATLEVTNGSTVDTVENFLASVQVYDQAGNVVNTLFGIDTPDLFTLTAVDGTGTLAPSAEGTARWLIVPTRDAAPMTDTEYFVGGLFSYTLGGTNYAVALEPVSITVRPDASLTLHYFWQRDVVGDDPFTSPVEPSEPFAIGLLIENLGFGDARNLRVTSNQPEIVENEDGLLVSFELISTRVGSELISPSLTVNFGDLAPMDTAVAEFLLLSSLQGQFLADYSVGTEHQDDFGNPRTSLIDQVLIHELIRVVRSDTPVDDVPDFLTNEVSWPDDPNEVDPTDPMAYDPDRVDVADTLRHSDGSVSPVTAILNAPITLISDNIVPVPAPQPSGLLDFGPSAVADLRPSTVALLEAEYEITLPGPITDWTYLKIPSPVDGRFRLASVMREDGTQVPQLNAWVTDRVFQEDDPPLREYRLHLLDNQGSGVYRLIFDVR